MTASTDLRASPLGAWSARFAAASAALERFAIRELPFTAQINLRGNPAEAAFAGHAAQALGTPLPQPANTWTGGNECTVLWLGPDEWLVAAADGRAEALCGALRRALAGTHHSVTDLSANRTAIEISGDDARSVLAKGTSLAMHAAAFAPPQCAQSWLAKAQVILQCCEVRPVFRLYVRNSFADYLACWLVDAATESGASLEHDARRIASRLA